MKKEKLSLVSCSGKDAIFVAFGLMSVIPLLTVFLIWNVLAFPEVFRSFFPYFYDFSSMVIIISILIFLAILGLRVIIFYVHSGDDFFAKNQKDDRIFYNKAYIEKRLEEEVKRSLITHRPCSFVLIQFNKPKGLSSEMFNAVRNVVLENLSDIDRAGILNSNEFALIIPEKNKIDALEIASNIKKKLDSALSKLDNDLLEIKVSECPIDGTNYDDLIKKAS